MPEPNLVSFRAQTTGGISDLLNDEGLSCAGSQDLLSYLAGALLSYKEEGVEFLPSIVLCNSVDEFLTAFPGSIHHVIGEANLASEAGPRILKDCAPLSGTNWYIYIERDEGNDKVRYGVFTYFKTPTAIPLHEGVGINPDQFSVLIRKASTNTIDIRGSRGHGLILLFSTLRELSNSEEPISKFADKCGTQIENEKLQTEFSLYFFRLLDALLTSCHGTILVCGNELDFEAAIELQDAVHVEPLLDFFSAFSELKTTNSAESILSLQQCEELLKGFLRCDGIIVMDGLGRVSAYRVFFRPADAANDANEQVVGGARRRAFEGLKPLVGTQLDCILFRSQDGHTLFYGGEQ
ncbi:hypothetical protein ACFFUT_09210 [Pseudohalocynthiibacter aestuariivivens]|uniref:Uncharacterized protein n=1 Tax=Pseudohalocynthiibacter aestuariivivens TaxID=1591409 RepID=A0ABV5JER8_9RHOB|nr:hypothetical protein [Pseudohalocynthiibacter aestuariivivens]MBS9718511.1 hypothetical protein [Pseudohalocynthiibacter aestuariivivens]